MTRYPAPAALVFCAAILAACASTSVPPPEGQEAGRKPAEVLETAGGVIKTILSFFSVGVVVR
jgi:hypothetical protein